MKLLLLGYRRGSLRVFNSAQFCRIGLAVVSLLLCALPGQGHQEPTSEPPLPAAEFMPPEPDLILPQIATALHGLATTDVAALRSALHAGEGMRNGSTPNVLTSLGDLDGDGVAEMLLQLAIPDPVESADITQEPDSRPFWALYLVAWTGAEWRASRLNPGVEEFTHELIHPGPPIGRALVIVTLDGESRIPYPAI